MNKIILKCKISTYLFMGGADPSKAELRTQSFNGMFRYWFRLAGGNISDEQRIFGSTSTEESGSAKRISKSATKGLINIRVAAKQLDIHPFQKQFDSSGRQEQGSGINYIGFSLAPNFSKKNSPKPSRKYINVGQEFELIILPHIRATEMDIKKFLCSVWLAFYLGNFGARARRGFGSISITSVEGDFPKDFSLKMIPEKEIDAWLYDNLSLIFKTFGEKSEKDTSIPNLQFEDDFKIYRIKKENVNRIDNWKNEVQKGRKGKFLQSKWHRKDINNPYDLLDFMGFLLMAFRSYYGPDYSNVKSAISGQANISKPVQVKRAIFGLPLNFFFSSLKSGGQVNLYINNKPTRRASPLWFKIIEHNNNCDGFFFVLKSDYIPQNTAIKLKEHKVELPENIWEPIDNFITSLENKQIIVSIY